MRYYFIGFFHIVIIALFLGCGYKAPPSWENKKNEVKPQDIKIFDLNGTIKLEMGVK